MASGAMNAGCLLTFASLGTSILQGIGVSSSKIFSKFLILNFFIICGSNPDCLINVKKALSLGKLSYVIFITSSSVRLPSSNYNISVCSTHVIGGT